MKFKYFFLLGCCFLSLTIFSACQWIYQYRVGAQTSTYTDDAGQIHYYADGGGGNSYIDDAGQVHPQTDGGGLVKTDAGGSVKIDGGVTYNDLGLPPSQTVIAFGAGGKFNCAILGTKKLWCWGSNSFSVLGIGNASPAYSNKPMTCVGDSTINFKTLAAGGITGSALSSTGELFSWGNCASYACAMDPIVNSTQSSPAKSNTTLIFESLGNGYDHRCGITSTKLLYCWGNNQDGKIGDGTASYYDPVTRTDVRNDKKLPVQISGSNWTKVTGGGDHTCGLQGAKLFCWGANYKKQLGDTIITSSYVSTPTAIDKANDYKDISCGEHFTCAIRTNGSLWCWGLMANYSTIDGSESGKVLEMTTPTQMGTYDDWTQVSAGHFHACAVKNNGSIYCWGSNLSRQLSYSSIDISTVPVIVEPNSPKYDWKYVSAGGYHTCAIKNNNTVYCWGQNDKGQIGNGSTANPIANPSLVEFTI